MKNSKDRILTTHAGSLVRTPEIVEVMIKRELGEAYDEEQHRRHVSEGVRQVVAEQVSAGVDVVSDGEYGKNGWIQYVTDRFEGFEQMAGPRPGRIWPEWDRFGDFYTRNQVFENTA